MVTSPSYSHLSLLSSAESWLALPDFQSCDSISIFCPIPFLTCETSSVFTAFKLQERKTFGCPLIPSQDTKWLLVSLSQSRPPRYSAEVLAISYCVRLRNSGLRVLQIRPDLNPSTNFFQSQFLNISWKYHHLLTPFRAKGSEWGFHGRMGECLALFQRLCQCSHLASSPSLYRTERGWERPSLDRR